jgi:glutamate/tyrosine decarboxylase-like PLP-dependent enzyme
MAPENRFPSPFGAVQSASEDSDARSSVDETLEALETHRGADVAWRSGRAFSLVYSAGEEVTRLAEEAYRRFSGENALNMAAFPSLRRFQDDVVGQVARWCSAPEGAKGFMTSGGTESLVLAVLAARRRRERDPRAGSTRGRWNVVLPTSAHAAFSKGCDYFGIEERRVPVGRDWRADPVAIADACDESTILLVASAPQYPQGVVDPVAEIAAIAERWNVNCHVDACMGGVVLPYLERDLVARGATMAPWDFRCPGVTSMSVDLHKYGYAAKGAGVIVHADARLRMDQTFTTDRWLGGVYGSPGVLGTKSGGAMAAAWAVMTHLGDAGYERLARLARGLTLDLCGALADIDGLAPLAAPDTTLIAIGADGTRPVRPHALADALSARGWYVDRQGPPESVHLTVNAIHRDVMADFVADLSECADGLRREPGASGSTGGGYATLE